MISFDAPHRAVHYPEDRRFRIWIRPSVLALIAVLVIIPAALAWIRAAFFGLPHIAPSRASAEEALTGPHAFPVGIRSNHFFNLFFVFILMRSGISILMDHPGLYFNDDSTPGTESIRFTPLWVPTDCLGRAKDNGRYTCFRISE